jgi:hypothetical protein
MFIRNIIIEKKNKSLTWRPNEYKPHNILKRKSLKVSKSDIINIKSSRGGNSKSPKRGSPKKALKSAKENVSPSINSSGLLACQQNNRIKK